MIKKKINILIVDDMPANLFALESIISEDDRCIIRAKSGEQALKVLLKNNNIALILMDVMMPKMDGFETAEIIQRSKKNKNIPIIFLTAMDSEMASVSAYNVGAADYVAKPFAESIIRAKVNVFVELHRHRTNLEDLVNERTKELLISRNQAIASSQAKELFLTKMTHELRTPLNAIIGYSGLIKENIIEDDIGSKDILPDLALIQHSGDRLLRLIEQILDFSQLGASDNEPFLCLFALNDLINTSIQKFEKILDEKNNKLEVNIKQDQELFTDQYRLQQVLESVLDNACKFTKNGTLKFYVRIEQELDQKYIIFIINDTGIGINQQQIEDIFSPFHQADNSLSRANGGAGLGLSLCLRTTQILGGKIYTTSIPNQGSTFIIKIPASLSKKEI
jgi:two-component system, sensor histidine kinase